MLHREPCCRQRCMDQRRGRSRVFDQHVDVPAKEAGACERRLLTQASQCREGYRFR